MTEIEYFLNEIRASANTKRIFKNTLRLFERSYGHLPQSSVEAQEFIRKREEAGLSAATIGLDVATFMRYLKFHNIPTNRLERFPVTLAAPEYLSKKEISTLMASSNQMSVRTMIALLYDSGARISEILGVKVDDIDWNGALRVIRKGGRQEWANVSPWGMDHLAKWMDTRTGSHPKVFGGRNYHDMYRLCKTAAKKAGVPHFTPHMLRHSRAVHLREEGVSWEEIGYQLGHVNPAITLKYYTRPDTYDLKKAIPPVTMES
jgi:integrase/recombinase XerD